MLAAMSAAADLSFDVPSAARRGVIVLGRAMRRGGPARCRRERAHPGHVL